MARYWFGQGVADFSINPPSATPTILSVDGAAITGVVLAASNQTGTVALTEGGTPETDLRNVNDVAISTVSTNSNGFLIRFQGPDEVKSLWVTFDEGVTWRLIVSAEAVAQAADYVPPVVIIGPAESEPPVGTPAGTLVFREL